MHLSYLETACKTFLFLVTIYIFSLSSASAQVHQMYLDADEDNHINKISFYSPNEGYVAFSKWIGYTTDSGRTYTKKFITATNVNYGSYTNINVTFGFGIEGVKAFDKNTLIVYGDYGLVPAILYSTDGGNSYKLVFHSQYDPLQLRTGIRDIVFPQNDNTGYAVDADRILKTTDKGMTWFVQIVHSAAFFDHLEAIDNNNVIAISTHYNGNTLLKTSNGGAWWQRITLPQEGILTYAYFLNANIGWLSMYSGEYRYFYKTTNGGLQWTLQNDVDATPFNCDKMRFTDVNTGFALVAPYQVYKTTNSGVTWEPLSRETDFTYLGYSHNDLQCLSATQLWAGGGHGYLEMTANGGGTPIAAAYFKTDTTGMYMAGTVQLLNFSRTGCQYQWLVNGSLVGTSYNATYTHDIVRSVDTIQLIVSAGGISDTLTKYPQFYAGGVAKASFWYPKSGSAGTFVTISGSRFTNISGVSFGGAPAASFSVLSDTVITAVVAGGASGTITLKQFYGIVPVGEFTFNPPPASLPPVIQAVSPSAGIPGTTITITGSGFGATASQNKVLFGTVPATLQSASLGQLVCTVPVGASLGTIKVLNKDNGLLGESPAPFRVPFADSAANFTPYSFTEGTIVNKGIGTPGSIRGEDIDGDGKPDLVVELSTWLLGDSMAVLRNTTKGGRLSFATRVNVGRINTAKPGHFAINDLDGDGRPDLVTATNGDWVQAFRNTSSPGVVSFEGEFRVPAGRGTQEAVITDLDNDGKNDIAVTSFEQFYVSVMRNTSVPGSLSFGVTQNFNTSEPVVGLAAGDLDGDGLKEVLAYPQMTSGSTNGSILLFQNTSSRGNISFASFVRVSVPGISFQASFISIMDFDMDGQPDIVICNDQAICVLRSKSTIGNFSFLPPVVIRLHTENYVSGRGGCLSNFSGSVRADVVFAHSGLNRQLITAKNNSQPGTPILDSLVYGPAGNSTRVYPYAVGAADFDADGKPDLAVSTASDSRIVIVYKNTVNAPVITPMCTSRQGGNKLESDLSGKTYQWQQDAGSGFTNVVNNANLSGGAKNSLLFVNTPDSWNGYKYRCIVDGRYSSTFVLQLNYAASPGIIVKAPDTSFCLGTNVTFTATDSTGYKSDYLWQWQINGKNTGYYNSTLSTNSLQDLDQVRVIHIYNDICGLERRDTSNAITVHVNGATASVQISASDLAACAGTPITFTATPVNPGSLPVYDWKVNNVSQGIDNAIFTSSRLKKNDIVQVLMKSAATCAYPNPALSNVLRMAVTDTSAPSVRISTTTPVICEGTNVLFVAIAQNPGPTSSYQWTVNGINTGTNANFFNSSTLRDKDMVQCVLTSPAACRLQPQASSGIITMSVNSSVIPSVSLSINDTTICAGNSVVITAHPVNAGSAPVYQWKNNGQIAGNNSPTYTINGLTKNTTVSVLLRSTALCANPDSAASAPVVITATPAPGIRIFGDTVVVEGAKNHLTATTSYSGTDDLQYQWQDSTRQHTWQNITGTAGDTINYVPVTSGDKIRCVCRTYAGCTATSNTIAMRINVPTATPDIPSVDAGYRWYPNPVSSTLYVEDENRLDPVSTITVYSNLGITVLVMNNTGRQTTISTNVSTLSTGVYFVEMRRRSGKTSHFQFLKMP